MRSDFSIQRAGVWSLGMLLLASSAGQVRADEPSRLSRLFRIGGPPAAVAPKPSSPVIRQPMSAPAPAPAAMPLPAAPAPSTPDAGAPANGPRIAPQPRNSKAPTDADPIVTRISIGRSDNGSQFGMFLHVYADGTVVDSEGIHRVGQDSLKPTLDALRQGEIHRQKGHCGGPPTDFVEQVHVVVYERSYGKLKATAFTYSGNTHGCDPSIKHLHTALDNLQARMAGQAAPTSSPTPGPAPRASVSSSGPVLGLSPSR